MRMAFLNTAQNFSKGQTAKQPYESTFMLKFSLIYLRLKQLTFQYSQTPLKHLQYFSSMSFDNHYIAIRTFCFFCNLISTMKLILHPFLKF
ncbi:hypothetical protein FGO68_gene11762 [Halteria grandinella]|uniref:Uncharacterized protein n=1 Tax=Halteria grandinella TaxID=5974 RepID=A0A8J8T5F8_HALGN|nr:hypothetical protein FGO68_gene11762 [Halteria grandinella]